ncbi:MAG: hypothetical protein IPP30_01170 [Flavobacterium sp.]|nr:hypothetical protein [Flavobacterium sp.]
METKGKVVVGNGTDSKLYTFGGYSETVSFGENFENIGVVSDILTSPYWENFNEVGTKLYRCVQYNYNRYAQISAYSTVLEEQEPTNISWLVSREIMVNSTDDKFLSFDTADGYNTGAVLEVYLITGYNGDINTCTKTLLNANISNAGPIDGYSNVFINSGLIPLAGNFNYFRMVSNILVVMLRSKNLLFFKLITLGFLKVLRRMLFKSMILPQTLGQLPTHPPPIP